MKKKMDIIYEDKELLIVNKPTKRLTVGTDKIKENTLYHEASDYVKKSYPKNKVFIVNRLDRETSGLVVFAKNEVTKKNLQAHWDEVATREYLAIVEGKVTKKEQTLKSYLREDKTLRVYETTEKNGRLAITHYEVLASIKAYSLLKIRIETGRKNQIRVQLSGIGHPIIGDKKYGATKNPLGRLGLHASYLELKTKAKSLKLFAKIPKEWKNMFEKEVITYEKNING